MDERSFRIHWDWAFYRKFPGSDVVFLNQKKEYAMKNARASPSFVSTNFSATGTSAQFTRIGGTNDEKTSA